MQDSWSWSAVGEMTVHVFQGSGDRMHSPANKKLVVTSATLLVTSALLVVTSATLLVTSALLVVTRS